MDELQNAILKSKSQKKRDAEALKQLGLQLIELSLEKLNTLPLTDALKTALVEAKSLKSHGAVRRQAQLIGKRMRSADSEAILAAFEHMLAEGQAKTNAFHVVEHWRKRLIQGEKDALTEFVETYHPEEVQFLRQLIKKAQDEQAKNINAGASKALFRHIREYIQ